MLDYPEDEHDVRVMCGDPMALAYEGLKSFTAECNRLIATHMTRPVYLTLQEVIDAGMSWATAIPESEGYNITRGRSFENFIVPNKFWDDLGAFKKITIPPRLRVDFLSYT